MSEWISVKERLPIVGQCVLICSEEGGVAEGVYAVHPNEWIQFRWSTPKITVTHWMPLPEPPATGSETERVRCADCNHLVFSDCYGECGAGHRGIVRPDDTCPHGERRDGDEGIAV
jgi:hypothetical protein